MITMHRDKNHNGLIAMVSTCKNIAKIDMTETTKEKQKKARALLLNLTKSLDGDE